MAKHKSVFYAYPSQPADLSETIEAATKAILKTARSRVRISTWRQLSVPGKLIVKQIIKAIDDADIFACDLTYLNPNVLFELGYAVGRQKRIWISLNTTIDGARGSFSQLAMSLVPDLGYASYTNRNELAEQFLKTQPWADTGDTLLGSGFSFRAQRPQFPALLYVRQPFETDASAFLSDTIAQSAFGKGTLVDDPKDNPISTLSWYAEKIRDTDATVVHLLSTAHEENYLHNLKCAFVAGLSQALQRQTLMMAPTPYVTPFDYRELLHIHSTAADCESFAREWLTQAAERVPSRPSVARDPGPKAAPRLLLGNVRIGEYVAEHEQAYLPEYFFETSWFRDALNSQHTIFVGRRGVGKSATLYAIQNRLGPRRYNHVCTIMPVGYEVDGLVRLLSQSIDRSERGYLIESLWKFLIYTELANSVVEAFYAQQLHEQSVGGAERELVTFVEQKPSIFQDPFSTRLDRTIAPLLDLAGLNEPAAQRTRISEQLHVGPLRELRLALGRALTGRQEVRILLDRLDEPWKPHHNIDLLAELLIGLLRVVVDISQDLRRSDSRRLAVPVNVTVFIRSDIFYHVQRLAPEQDKLPAQVLSWDDPELMLALLDQRLQSSFDWNFGVDQIWDTLFTSSVKGMHPKRFLAEWALGRPRDVIYMAREAIATATNRRHAVVTEDDLMAARRRYSEFAFRAILAEDDPTKGRLEAILFGFAGTTGQLSETAVHAILHDAGVEDDDIEFYENLLCDVTFLGVRSGSEYRYARDEGERRVLREVARRVASRAGESDLMFRINPAFHDVLAIR